MLYPHDLISCPETLLLCCTVLLNTGDKDADIISSRQPQTHTVTFLETHHHRVRPALWKHGNNSWQRKSLFMTETTKLASCFWVNLSLSNSIKTNKQQLTNTDPYISRSSALGFSGTLGGAWTFGATLAAGTAETKSFTVSIQFNCDLTYFLQSCIFRAKSCLPGGVSERGSSLSACKAALSSTSLSAPLNGVGMAPIFASLLGGSSLVISQIFGKFKRSILHI